MENFFVEMILVSSNIVLADIIESTYSRFEILFILLQIWKSP